MDMNLPIHRLDLRVRELRQLFNSMDPAPFLNKDLDREAEAYIESWALGLSTRGSLHLVIHVEQPPAQEKPEQLLTEAIHNYFEYKASLVRSQVRQMLRLGCISLLIGLAFVTACLVAADAVSRLGKGPSYTVVREGLTIIGWVALWKPVQIFLYDWWPLRRCIRVYRKLADAHIEVVAAREGDPGSESSIELNSESSMESNSKPSRAPAN